MFETEGLTTLLARHRPTLEALNTVVDRLNGRFYEMEDAVECLALTALSGEAMVMIGRPGTAKSRLIRSFCHLLGLVSGDSLSGGGGVPGQGGRPPAPVADDGTIGYFEYLLTEFTEPSELFGFYDLTRLERDGLVRDTRNMMQTARVVFLDEVFNASSAILNALLTFMNERKFHDRGAVIDTPLQLLFAATNHPPRESTLAAVYDRFLLRCHMTNLSESALDTRSVVDLVRSGWTETHRFAPGGGSGAAQAVFPDLLGGLEALRADVKAMTRSGALAIDLDSPLFARLTDLVRAVVRHELGSMSNRRLIKLCGVVLCVRLLRAARAGAETAAIEPRDLDVIIRYGLERQDPSRRAILEQELEAT